MIEKSCAFTGHRPVRFSFKYDERHVACRAIKKELERQIVELIQSKGVTQFYTGMALGVDMWAAEIVLSLKARYPNLRLIAAIPCESQADKWNFESQRRYRAILAKSDEVTYVCRAYTRDCMLRRNRFMVDNSEYLIAVYDEGGSGGTAYTVQYARGLGREVSVIPVA